ncbi:hypothetical protein [Arthrobacter crystallopoietes]|jgi:hypothetical protein|nr:hypothetical protein [Arthrobacter crystallopoietes]
MADKSPRQSMSKKPATSIKQKRTDKKAGAAAASELEKLTKAKKN